MHNADPIPLDAPDATLERVGGKGANLARMVRAGYPVPGGFLIPVAAYHAYVAAALPAGAIPAILAAARLDDPADLERASQQIRALFRRDALPAALAESIIAAYRALGAPVVADPAVAAPPVAVRSSATAEDLPEMSFAGQQDTYLNICGEEALLCAVVACWGSLWTARAIGYRARQGISQDGLGLAVVVQCMVASEASGVLFTANPLTGLRSQSVIDATLGLGEALVSGLVEPDHYVVDTSSGQIIEKRLGGKALAILPDAAGGTRRVMQDAVGRQALPDAAIRELVALGQRMASEYDSPQDIEWGWAGGKLYLLQTRAITSLFPVPDGSNAEDLRVLLSFGAMQGMLDPITPLGRDVIAGLVGGAAALLGMRRDEISQGALSTAAERLWIDATSLVRNPVGRKAVRGALRFIEESGGQTLEQVWDDPRLQITERHLKPRTARMLAGFILPVGGRVLLTLLRPAACRRNAEQFTEAVLADFQRRQASVTGDPVEKLRQRVALLRATLNVVSGMMRQLLPVLAAGMSQFYAVLRRQATRVDAINGTGSQYSTLALETLRGLQGNVTTEMDLRLWDSAQAIRADEAARDAFARLSAEEVAEAYRRRALPTRALEVLDAFLQPYGMRGLAEIDIGRARWQEEPLHVIQALGSYLQINDASRAPDVVFARGEQAALAAVETLARAAGRLSLGALRARLVRFAAGRMRALVSVRETPKFLIVRFLGAARMGFLDSGREFTRLGLLEQPEDIFYLRLRELEALADGSLPGAKAAIAGRRAAYARELRRRQIPRLLLSDGRAFYEGMAAPVTASGANGLQGDPVSPGVAEGIVHVVLDPRGAQLAPGEILVCPGTDPSWTPLFLAAGALVMEVGGMMTHGAVVAREYGIPAVVGVHQASTRLRSGQRIRVNGSSGEITLLEEGSAA